MGDSAGEAGFTRRLAALGPEAFREFVRDVYGHRDGNVVVDRHGSPLDPGTDADGCRRLYVHHPADGTLPDLAPSVDAVVVPTRDRIGGDVDVSVVDPTELFRVARYGLDADVGDEVCRRHLHAVPRPSKRQTAEGIGGVSGGADTAAPRTRRPSNAREESGAGSDAILSAGGRTWMVLVVGLLLFFGGAAVGHGLGSLTAATADDADPGTTAVTDVGGVATPVPTAIATPSSTPWATVTVSQIDTEPLSAAAVDRVRERYANLEPTCDRPPDLVIQLQVNALKHDNGTDATVRTVYRFASPDNRQRTRPFENFAGIVRSDPFEELLDHERAEYGPLVLNGTSARQQVRVTTAAGDTETYRFRLSRQESGEYEGCWMTDSVEPLIPGT